MGSHVIGHNILKQILHLSLLNMQAELVKNHVYFLKVNGWQDNLWGKLKMLHIELYTHLLWISTIHLIILKLKITTKLF